MFLEHRENAAWITWIELHRAAQAGFTGTAAEAHPCPQSEKSPRLSEVGRKLDNWESRSVRQKEKGSLVLFLLFEFPPQENEPLISITAAGAQNCPGD